MISTQVRGNTIDEMQNAVMNSYTYFSIYYRQKISKKGEGYVPFKISTWNHGGEVAYGEERKEWKNCVTDPVGRDNVKKNAWVVQSLKLPTKI